MDSARSRNRKLVFALSCAATALLLLLAACSDRPRVAPPPAPPAPLASALNTSNAFLGNAACKECHPAEFAAHRRSHHALALRAMDRESLGSQSPPTGQIANTGYTLVAKGERFEFGLAGRRTFPLQLVFGSGTSGMAFASIPMEGVLAEARMSYYPAMHRWFVTPGQQGMSDLSLGNVMQGDSARQCFPCHTITMPADSLVPERKFMGVGCESCHGPGGAHVAAMRAGDRAHPGMEKLGSGGGAQVNDLCGRCHRTEQQVVAKNLSRTHTDLFQAHGLAQSACFRRSNDRLTCLTCHNPHSDASRDERTYVVACLKCHAASGGTGAGSVRARACPVNATGKCIGCHMPKIPEPLFPGQPRNVADHYIRIHQAARPGGQTL